MPKDSNFASGAVRSADVSHLDFASLPLIGLLGAMRVAGGGGTKYGRFNYHHGMPIHETINHAIVHGIRWLLGDRSEPHLAKAAWGFMVAAQQAVLNPEMIKPHVLGPGATFTPEMLAELERGATERKRRREAGEFEELFAWDVGDMPEVQAILAQREAFPRLAEGTEPIKTAWGEVPDYGPMVNHDHQHEQCDDCDNMGVHNDD